MVKKIVLFGIALFLAAPLAGCVTAGGPKSYYMPPEESEKTFTIDGSTSTGLPMAYFNLGTMDGDYIKGSGPKNVKFGKHLLVVNVLRGTYGGAYKGACLIGFEIKSKLNLRVSGSFENDAGMFGDPKKAIVWIENKENGDILGKKSDCPVSYEDGGYQYIVTPSQ